MRGVTAGEGTSVELLVLDAHGVIFNNPWREFLDDMAAATGRSARAVHTLWYEVLHDDAWLGVLAEDEMWRRLTGQPSGGARWRADLEARYRLTGIVRHLSAWRDRVPVWVLSNHRTDWLVPRLARFGILDAFERVLVSDALGAMKPDLRAFREVIEAVDTPDKVLFVDDRQRNVDAAVRLGFATVRADESAGWLADVDRAIHVGERGRMPGRTSIGA